MTTENTKNVENNPLTPYANAAGEVVGTIGARAQTDGDPQMFGAVYGALCEAYLPAVGSTRPIGQADAHILDVLRAVALLASGGVQAQRFRDIISAALAGSVHVEAASAYMAERARAAQNKPETAAEPVQEPDDGHGFKPEPAAPPTASVEFEVHPFRKPAPEGEEVTSSAELDALNDPKPVVLADGGDLESQYAATSDADPYAEDTERASDADLLRWSLNPGADPWSDLLGEPIDGTESRARRDGVTEAEVQVRFDRLHAILDTAKAPKGVTKDDWQAAQRRVLPSIYGDRGPA